jgi:cold shock CspA family protein
MTLEPHAPPDARGTVIAYFRPRLFGFVIGDDDGRRFFFHRHDVEGPMPAVGACVEFEPASSARGWQAFHVRIAAVPPDSPICGLSRTTVRHLDKALNRWGHPEEAR